MGHHDDDFFLPRNVDYSEPCAEDSNIASGSVILPLGASLSVVCYLYLFWMYFVLQSPIFKRHPTTLAVYKCILELIFIQQYLWMPSIANKKFFNDDISAAPYECTSSPVSGYLAFITQFSLVGSELCFFIISYDLRIAYTNPFSSFQENRNFFFNLVIGISLLTSFILVLLGPRVYGMSDLGLVWIQKRREHGSPNYPKAVLYYIITICVFIYSLWANFRYNIDSEKGFSKTVSNRLSIMQRSKKFTIGYVGYGSLVFLMQFISFVTQTQSPVVVNAPAYLLAFRGVWGLMVILYSNWSELTWDLASPFHWRLQEDRMKEDIAMEKLLLQPHLNTALRAEILYFTTQGIMFAARDYQRHVNNRTTSRGAGAHSHPGHTTESEDTEFSLNESSPANIRGVTAQSNERSQSTTAATPATHYSLSNLYHRRSLQNPARANAAAAAAASSSAQSIDDDGLDMGGADMFNRHSVAIFERLNKEQGEAVNKAMEVAWQEEAASLGLAKRNKGNAQAALGRASESSVGGPRTYNPFHTQAIGRNPLQKDRPSELGVEMKVGSAATARPGDERDNSMIDDVYRESEVVDVEFGMNQNKSTSSQVRASGKISNTALWKRIETPPPGELARSMSSNSDRMTSNSTDGNPDGERHSRSSVISALLMNAMLSASDAAKSFFASSQFKEFRFKDFCPKLFGKVRELSGIDNEEYAKSFEKTCKEKFSEGRSGAFMFLSSNEKCIVKTTTKAESLALHAIMPQYVKHLKENPNSLVVRFLGAHCITMYGNELYFVVMLNVFPTFPLSERYDLKGSWVNRHGFEYSRKSKRERMRREPTEASPLYQDNDLQHKISLELDVTYSLASQIRRDVLFLRAMQLMDYSLLIGVRRERFKVLDSGNASEGVDRASHVSIMRDTELAQSFDANTSMAGRVTNSIVARPNAAAEPRIPDDAFKRDYDGGMRARLVEGPGTYYIGIIDVLQEWNFTKQMERFLKIYFKRYDGDGLSAIEPVAYSERFWRGAVLDTFDGLEYDTEEILKWRGDEAGQEEGADEDHV